MGISRRTDETTNTCHGFAAFLPLGAHAKLSSSNSYSNLQIDQVSHRIQEKRDYIINLLGGADITINNSSNSLESVEEELDMVIEDLLDGFQEEVRQGLNDGEFLHLACANPVC